MIHWHPHATEGTQKGEAAATQAKQTPSEVRDQGDGE